jgi:hypothetical protein
LAAPRPTVDPLALLGRERLTDRDALDEADDRDENRRHQELAPEREVEGGQRQRRQALRHVADDGHPVAAMQPEAPGGERRHRHRRHRAGLGDDVGEPRAEAERAQERLQPAADPEQEGDRAAADDQRPEIGAIGEARQRPQDVEEIVAARRHAQDVLELARRDDQRRGGDEAGDHRVAQKVGEKAQAQHAQEQEKQA